MRKRLVVITGSFNPVTRAHYQILSDAVDYVGAEKGLFVTVSEKYLIKKTVTKAKSRTNFRLSPEVRGEMLESLSKENPKLSFWGFELGGASSATDKTLTKIMRENPEYDVYFLFGADKLDEIPHWQNAEGMLSKLHVIVSGRADIDLSSVISKEPLLLKYQDHFVVLPEREELAYISSTAIRDRFFAGEDYEDMMMPGPYEIMKRFKPSDFKPITHDEIIEAQIRYGGSHGKSTARGLAVRYNKEYYKNLSDLSQYMAYTSCHEELRMKPGNVYSTVTEVVNEDAVNTAERLIKEGYHPVILNPASATKPCGLFDENGYETEEYLCYQSTLPLCLMQFSQKRYILNFGGSYVPGVYPICGERDGIYSPNVLFFRNNEKNYYSLRKNPFLCPVISVASLSNSHNEKVPADASSYFTSDGFLSEIGVATQKNKIRTIFRMALENGHDAIVLGAFGCGSHELFPEEVSRLFKDVLEEEEFKNRFRLVSFAIWEGKGTKKHPVGREGKFKSFYELTEE